MLRAAGFKVLLHWMPNLLGATAETDRNDFARLFNEPDFCPDELKIYPCTLVKNTELEAFYQRGQWRPYPDQELLELIKFALSSTPRYCRVTRVIRDISSGDILAGNRRGNLREIAQRALQAEGSRCQEMRGREIRGRPFDPDRLQLSETAYRSGAGEEHFLELATPRDELVGFARLTLPSRESFVPEIARSALIREVRVYGAALDIGFRRQARPQHQGLGQLLVETALSRARTAGFARIAVISAVGTRDYYRRLGFCDGELYQHRSD
jgi:elongator complex protein 3